MGKSEIGGNGEMTTEEQVGAVMSDLEGLSDESMSFESGEVHLILQHAKPNEPFGDEMDNFVKSLVERYSTDDQAGVRRLLGEFFMRDNYFEWIARTKREGDIKPPAKPVSPYELW